MMINPTPIIDGTRVSGSDDSFRCFFPATIVNTPIGRLMKNAHRQLSASTIAAPSVGPSAPATPPVAPQIATACGTLSRGNACITRASDDGISTAAPAACRMRKAMRSSIVGASPQAMDAIVNSVEPARKARRWPNRSAILPAGIRSAANTIVYALRTHDSVVGEALENVAEMSGNATYRIVVSRNVARVASDATASVTRSCRSNLLVGVGARGAAVVVIRPS